MAVSWPIAQDRRSAILKIKSGRVNGLRGKLWQVSSYKNRAPV
jgi:hypothetical protein